ncbi:MAG: glycerate kinase [Polaromonas sp.]|nr:glycerate kinase [Polaromonas sp.]
MNFRKILVPIAGACIVVLAYRAYGWAGVAAAVTGVVMWLLLNFTRMMTVLKRAADRPMGYVASAVMLNAKLKPGVTLMHVVAMTRALGELRSPRETQPEIFRWTDGSGSHVDCTFVEGKLTTYALFRPEVAPDTEVSPASPDTAASTGVQPLPSPTEAPAQQDRPPAP